MVQLRVIGKGGPRRMDLIHGKITSRRKALIVEAKKAWLMFGHRGVAYFALPPDPMIKPPDSCDSPASGLIKNGCAKLVSLTGPEGKIKALRIEYDGDLFYHTKDGEILEER